ncbi:hypothetical protein AB0953_07110 [Streptomyces sp. NPDC046866]|uniref:hypothetical protein n=1 Tax=Streptomyces sp. NPDC046866 TaxID=3154921 RepID=UPI0034526842
MLAHHKKTVGAALTAVLLVGGATACQNGKKDDSGKAAAAGAPSASASAPADRGGAAQAAPAALLEGARKASEEIGSVHYTMSGSTPEGSFTGDVSAAFKPQTAMSMKMTSPSEPGRQVEIRMVDGAMYMGAEGKWLKFDLKALDPKAADGMNSLGKAPQSAENPADRANDLLQSKDLKVVGEETLDGQKTQHLSGTVTLEQMRASAASGDPATKERRERSLKPLEAQGITSMVVDMWIDDTHHTKQVRTQGKGAKGAMDVTIKMLDFNKPVDVAAPPADQVVDLAEMMKNTGEGSA